MKPNGVIVCTPNNLHCPVTLAALKRGIHVICEKPVSLNANEAASMVKAATEKSLICMVNFPYRSNPCVIKFRELIAQRWLGLPLHISGQYHGGFGLYRKPGWRGSTTQSGAGILGDLGSHLIDLARYISGDEFKAVTAHMMTTIWQKPDDPDFVL